MANVNEIRAALSIGILLLGNDRFRGTNISSNRVRLLIHFICFRMRIREAHVNVVKLEKRRKVHIINERLEFAPCISEHIWVFIFEYLRHSYW